MDPSVISNRMWIETEVGTTTAEQPYVKYYKAADQQQVKLQESAMSLSLFKFVASKANVTEADIMSRGTGKISIKMSDYEKCFRWFEWHKPAHCGVYEVDVAIAGITN